MLEVSVDERDFLESGWQRVRPDAPFPTFTTSRPSAVPGRRPAGLALCPREAVARWKADLHRFPPYQYRAENCVTNRQGVLRVPSVKERDVILGFPVDYTRRCLVKSMEGSTAHNDCRLTFSGTVGPSRRSHICCIACLGHWVCCRSWTWSLWLSV